METKLPLHLSHVQQRKRTINILHTLVHFTALLALLYYRFSSLHQQYNYGFIPFVSWLLLSFSELLQSFLWVLGQASRWRPVSRTVYPERLPEDKELQAIDVFICTADPKKEPTLGVMNTVISAMTLDYPSSKLFVYLSDDAGAPITLYGMKEAYKFAKKWIPFCKKYGIQTIAPDAYFSGSDHEEESGLLSGEFVKHKHQIEEEYQVYKQRLERAIANGIISSPTDRPCLIEVISDHGSDKTEEQQANMPFLIYVSREKSRTHPHNFKAGALNVLLRVSGVISNSPYILFLDCDMYCNDPSSARQAMCFHLDPQISFSLAFVQFPQKFHNISKNDIYNDLVRIAFEVQWYGMDGLKGPILSGSCLYLNRESLFRSPTDKAYRSDKIVNITDNNDGLSSELLEEARVRASCNYEKHTQWGQQIGFMYHSVAEDNLTGFCMHCKGWISVYINPSRPAFLGSAPANLSDSLIQTIRWYSGLLQVGFSKFCPLIYGPLRMSLLQSMVYASYAFQALSALPMLCYAIVPQLCLLTGIALYPKVSDPWFLIFAIIYVSWHFQRMFEVLSTGGSLRLSWNHTRILIIKSVTSFVIACLNIMIKLIGAKEIGFVPTNKVVDAEQDQRYKKDVIDFQAGTRLLLPLSTIVMLNVVSFFFGLTREISNITCTTMFGQIFLSLFILVLSYPILEGMYIRKDKGRIPSSVTMMTLAFVFVILAYVLL